MPLKKPLTASPTGEKKSVLTADQAKLLPQKYCIKHNKRYIIDKDFSLCCHNDCFGGSVNKFMNKNKIYHHIRSAGLLEDYHSWLQLQLLEELREKNKPPVLNFIWLLLKTRNFYTNVLGKGLMPLASLPSGVRKERSYLPINEEIIDEIDNINNDSVRDHRLLYQDNPESTMLGDALQQEVVELVGSVMLSYLNDVLTLQDIARINKQTLPQARKWIKDNKEILRKHIDREVHKPITPMKAKLSNYYS